MSVQGLNRIAIEMPSPIQTFSVEEFGIPLDEFLKQTQPFFYQLPWDDYDARREQIDFLRKSQGVNEFDLPTLALLCDYFTGEKKLEDIRPLYKNLSDQLQSQFLRIKPFRKRAISRFIVEISEDGWFSERIPACSFSQIDAKIEEAKFDLRKLPRIFTEIEDSMVNNKLFYQLLHGVAAKVHQALPFVRKFDINVHHVLVETYLDRIKSNSPEGIHQDGYDYIVSALVVERKNVIGGESQIFADDKKTQIFSTTLQPGQGLLQPDRGTSLWHQVTPIVVKKDCENSVTMGHRSSIGFDIALVF